MKRRTLIRIQLFLLVALVGALLFRAFRGEPAPDGTVVLVDLSSGDLYQQSFLVEQPTTVALDVAGSVETVDGVPMMAAYGWLLDRTTREVVWKLSLPERLEAGQTLVNVQDTLTLAPGTYDAYYTTYGNTRYSRRDNGLERVFQLSTHWENDEDQWRFLIREAVTDGTLRMRRIERDGAPDASQGSWELMQVGNREHESAMFEVTAPTTVAIDMVGEWCNDSMCDYGYLENATNGERVWTATFERSQPAGGGVSNRRIEETVRLAPGVYRVHFETDWNHAYDDWRINPPDDPAAWGIRLAATQGSLQEFDAWTGRTPLIQLTGIGNSQLVKQQFVVEEPLSVLLYALGEVSTGGDLYDYAWLEHTPSSERIWKMSREATQDGGGSETNRYELAFLTLEPGPYTLYYQTDGSHAFGSWSNGEPYYPGRWGVTLFPLDAVPDSTQFSLLAAQPEPVVVTPEAPPPPPSADESAVALMEPPLGKVLMDQTQIGNEIEVEEMFTLDEATDLFIQGVGEIVGSGRYDYGWIENNTSGEVVWEMSFQNTEYAGGDARNRIFQDTITLEAGTYTARYKTDLWHAFGDFGDIPPAYPEHWGLYILAITE